MAAIVIKEEKPDTYFLKMPTKGVDCDDINMKEEKAKTAPKVIKDAYRKKGNGIQDNGCTKSGKSNMQRNGLPKYSEKTLYTKQPAYGAVHSLDVARCGEIFVTKNAKKWTFGCTFCQMSTRDIGEFVCHIKLKHMNFPNIDDDEEASENEYASQRDNVTPRNSGPDESYNQGQDYIDCTNYLDMNVHTEDSRELPPSKSEGPSLLKPLTPTKQVKLEANIRRGNHIINLLDDDDEDDNEAMKNQSDNEPMYFDYDLDGQDDEDVAQRADQICVEANSTKDDKKPLLLRRSSTENGDSNTTSGIDYENDTKKFRSHVKGTAYCEICNKTFQYYSLYRNHMIKHSNVTPFKCQFCNKGFKSKQAIRYHMNTHAKEKPYACAVCSATYATASLFMSHVMSHEGENCFPCMFCTKIFKTDRGRELHMEIHSQDRPYKCSFCSKRFRQKHHLSNHLKLHCQYRCDFCKQSFNSTQSQRRPYACETCEEKPDIRQQVERQRAIPAKTQEIPSLMKFENVMLQSTATIASPEAAVDMASDDESEKSNSLLARAKSNNFPQCKYCRTTYNSIGALNFHLKQRHSEHFS